MNDKCPKCGFYFNEHSTVACLSEQLAQRDKELADERKENERLREIADRLRMADGMPIETSSAFFYSKRNKRVVSGFVEVNDFGELDAVFDPNPDKADYDKAPLSICCPTYEAAEAGKEKNHD